jgi:LmbE family N-acetylglucosaminyl deacetylase
MAIGIDEIGTLGSILGIWAHPDDETYLSGGLMATAAARAQRVVCITATAGELGTSDRHPDPAALAPRRRRELAAALTTLGVREHVVLGLPDGGCADIGDSAPIGRLRRTMDWFGVDTVVTFGPQGATGHPDHRAVSRWVDLAVHDSSRHIRVLHAVTTPRDQQDNVDVYRHLGLDTGQPLDVVPDDEVAVEVVLDAHALARKLGALRAHESQTAGVFEVIGHQRMAEWLRVERFVDADEVSISRRRAQASTTSRDGVSKADVTSLR